MQLKNHNDVTRLVWSQIYRQGTWRDALKVYTGLCLDPESAAYLSDRVAALRDLAECEKQAWGDGMESVEIVEDR